MSDVYQKLAKHLDQLPSGFPATESGVELRILKRLFTPEEAEIATGLVMMPEPVAAIAARMGKDPEDLGPLLEAMSKKGLIFRSSKGGHKLYMAAQFVIGIWEYHVNDLDEELIRDVNEYIPYLSDTWAAQKTKQLRVIPVAESVEAEMQIMPYEAAEEIIRSQKKIVVAPCICRKEHKMSGAGCDKPIETCLVFGTGAFFYEENGLARDISKEEALGILKQGLDAGLVLQPGNAQRPTNICLCCGCCCQILKNLNNLEKPAQAVASNYYAVVDPEQCTGCAVCVDRCQMDAIAVEDVAVVDHDRCIGCGLCVPTCDFDAMSLKKKEGEAYIPPRSVVETYMNIAHERGLI
jgi:ferredoxin